MARLSIHCPGQPERVQTISDDKATLGRSSRCEIVLPDKTLSREQCRLERAGSTYEISDLGSVNGTRINGERITRPHLLISGDLIEIGLSRILFIAELGEEDNADTYALQYPKGKGKRVLPLGKEPLTIGRHPSCGLVLSDNSVSSCHAAVRPEENGYCLHDLDSKNGVYLNGEKITRALLLPGMKIRVGDITLGFKKLLKRPQPGTATARTDQPPAPVAKTVSPLSANKEQLIAPTINESFPVSERKGQSVTAPFAITADDEAADTDFDLLPVEEEPSANSEIPEKPQHEDQALPCPAVAANDQSVQASSAQNAASPEHGETVPPTLVDFSSPKMPDEGRNPAASTGELDSALAELNSALDLFEVASDPSLPAQEVERAKVPIAPQKVPLAPKTLPQSPGESEKPVTGIPPKILAEKRKRILIRIIAVLVLLIGLALIFLLPDKPEHKPRPAGQTGPSGFSVVPDENSPKITPTPDKNNEPITDTNIRENTNVF